MATRRKHATAIALILTVAACDGKGVPALSGGDPQYVGRQVCATCHGRETALWDRSHHALAMQRATANTVLGDFGQRSIDNAGVTTTFRREGDTFVVRTDGADGRMSEFPIAYTFGIQPLQQYLVPLDGGRYQALSLGWDTRAAGLGGQRWFHLYPARKVEAHDPLHWTRSFQNWNYMCSECHSTNVRRGYDGVTDRFNTTWSEVEVSCEACHGPGSKHVAWAKLASRPDISARGFPVRLAESAQATWGDHDARGIARRSGPPSSGNTLEVCGPCHSRRTPLTDGRVPGTPLAATHRVSLLDESLYFADGQILDEVFEYGSFLQSAMHRAGVTCTDCHDPHSVGKQPAGDAACARCHLPARFATPAHHHHGEGSAGASCVACHMPSRLYMVVDRRHDHSFRVPRPDLTVRIGVPNACASCHEDRGAAWAAKAVAKWFPHGRSGSFHYGVALHAGRTWSAQRGPLLRQAAADPRSPPIARATALTLMAAQLEPADVPEIDRALGDPDPLVRRAAVEATGSMHPRDRVIRLQPLLADPMRSIRAEAAALSAGSRPNPALDAAMQEYKETQRFNADRAEAWLNLGSVSAREGDFAAAEKAYRTALGKQPGYPLAAINLADILRAQKRDSDGEVVLRDALKRYPGSAELREAIALLLVRSRRLPEAVGELRRATSAQPSNPRLVYLLGVALHSEGRTDEAARTLVSAFNRFPAYRQIPLALASIARDRGRLEEARQWAQRYAGIAPSDPAGARLVEEMSRPRTAQTR